MGWRSTTSILALALLVAAAGCKKSAPSGSENPDDTRLLAQDGSDTASAEADHSLLASTLVAAGARGSISLASADELAGDIASADLGDGAKAFFFPRGCVTSTHDSTTRTVTYVFRDCSGPLGLLRVTGEVKVTYEAAPNQLTLDLVGTGLKANKATADFHAHAVITSHGLDRTMAWKAELSGRTARDREFTGNATKLIKWTVGERCYAFDGASEGDVKGRNIRTEITGYRRCQGSCPEAGGKVMITHTSTGKQVLIEFDGSSRAKVTTPKETLSVPMLCAG